MAKRMKIVISGVAGRMGKELLQLVKESDEWELLGAVEHSQHPDIGKEIIPGVFCQTDLRKVIKDSQVIVDFSTPPAVLEKLPIEAEFKKPVVIGTTGFSEEQKEQITRFSESLPLVCSANMSLGVNVLYELLRRLSQLLPKAEVEIVEYHHRHKKDAPSGTALQIAEIITQSRQDKSGKFIYGRHGVSGPREASDIGILAVRAGDIVGEHQVLWTLPGERLELIHRAHSRRTFAYGALVAARWIIGKAAGIYSMQDVLGLGR